jgi:hypothetical protein
MVVGYFFRNPEEVLTGPDIAEKYGVDVTDVGLLLSAQISSGVLDRVPYEESSPVICRRPGQRTVVAERRIGKRPRLAYVAGPVLLAAIGIRSEACMPVGG